MFRIGFPNQILMSHQLPQIHVFFLFIPFISNCKMHLETILKIRKSILYNYKVKYGICGLVQEEDT